MANEAEFAHWAGKVAEAMQATESSLQSLSSDLGEDELGKMLRRRQDELDMLKPGVEGVGAAEDAFDRAQGAAVDPARANIYSTYQSYQVPAGLLSNQIGQTRRDLEAHSQALAAREDDLQDALTHLDRIDALPDRSTREIQELREGVQSVQAVVAEIRPKVDALAAGVLAGQQAARKFADEAPAVDGRHAHSAAIGRMVGAVGASLSRTGTDAAALREELIDHKPAIIAPTVLAEGVANRAEAERDQVNKEASDLANSVRAGLNPTSPAAQHAVANLAESNLSSRLDGLSQDNSRDR